MNLNKLLTDISSDLVSEIAENSALVTVPKNAEVMHEGQYIKTIPLLTEGLIKVFTRKEDKEFLLYYIRPGESCIMSFDASIRNTPSTVYASAEEDSLVLLMPVDKVSFWIKKYPEINNLFYKQYNIRYTELIQTIHQVLFEKMDYRLLKYLKNKAKIAKSRTLKTSHQQIANDLGTAREVVTRVLKKLETEGKVTQSTDGIKII